MATTDTKKAGADAASDDQVSQAFRSLIDNDPEIQAVIKGVWGDTTRDQRPSDTPKDKEKANAAASKRITEILKARGIDLPDRTFINPRSGALEGHRGWSGLNGIQKAAIIAAGAVATGGALAATGALGGVGGALGGGGGSIAGGGGAATGGGAALGGGTIPMLQTAGTVAKLSSPAWMAGGAVAPAAAGTAATVGGGAAASGLMGAAKSYLSDPRNLAAIGRGVTGMAGAAAANRSEEGAFNQRRDQLALQGARDFEDAQQSRAELLLRQQAAQRDAETSAFRNALKAGLALNMKDASFGRPTGVPNLSFSGGARPSAIGEQGRAAAEAMNNLAMQRLMKPEEKAPLAPLERTQLSDQPKAGFWEKLAGPAGFALSAYGAARK